MSTKAEVEAKLALAEAENENLKLKVQLAEAQNGKTTGKTSKAKPVPYVEAGLWEDKKGKVHRRVFLRSGYGDGFVVSLSPANYQILQEGTSVEDMESDWEDQEG